ncbi:Ankyrin repeat domain-containing protein 33B [Chelonia mydas]|uniref:Ankyrin repeat domain-containing protein 33B n=1 Tax=Chelonia mydas TaxID=8469 RepID=M7BAP5_CHEMY|nr:Ankyrin repeat domain-containing protein 33B [Chelonia mydas]
MVLLSGDGTGAGELCGPGGRQKGEQQQVWPNAEGEKEARGPEGEQQEQVVAAAEEEEDYEEYEDFSELPDTCSIASDDSFYPPGAEEDEEESWSLGESDVSSPEPLSLFRACCTNNAVVLRALMRQGPEEEEVRETDRNNRSSPPRATIKLETLRSNPKGFGLDNSCSWSARSTGDENACNITH